jgi:hypothetical protein
MKRKQSATLVLDRESLLRLTGQATVPFTAFVNCSLRFCPTGEVVCPHEGP